MCHFSFDLDPDPLTFILKLDLHLVNMYLCTENEIPSSNSSLKVIARTDRDIDRQTETD